MKFLSTAICTLLLSLLIIHLAGCASQPQWQHRAPEQVARDVFRHPFETLEFFDVQPHMTVVEIWPGEKGWYTEVLAPMLRDQGKLYAAQFSENSNVRFYRSVVQKYKQKLADTPEVYDQVSITYLEPPKEVEIAPKGSADRVLTFRNVHNWMRNDTEIAVFQAMYDALKPGGILGVVEHRAPSDMLLRHQVRTGYVTESYVIKIAESVGFKLLARSEINANPKDTKNHPRGVWTLPPSLRLGNQDKDKYLAIGESDRMTLKFTK